MSLGLGSFQGVDSTLGTAIMLEATKRANQAEKKMQSFKTWTWEDYERFVRWMILDINKQEHFFAIMELAKSQGAQVPSMIEITNAPPLIDSLSMAVRESFSTVDHLGGISGLGSMIAEPDEGLRSWRIYNPTILTANIQRPGNIGRLNGELDSGKTNGFCVIGQQFLSDDPSHYVIANIKMLQHKLPERYYYITKASVLLRTIVSPDIWGRTGLFGMDEGALNYGKPDQTTTRVRQIDKFMRLVRKWKLSFYLIEQRPESVPNLMMEWSRNIYTFAKTIPHGIVTIELRGPMLNFRDTVKQFPKSDWPYDTDDPAMFEFDLNMDELHDEISGKDDQRQAILDYLNQKDMLDGVLPRKCAMPGCENEFTDDDKRRKYCDEHKRYHVAAKYGSSVHLNQIPEMPKPKTVDEFLES